jgi:hypothetical protein
MVMAEEPALHEPSTQAHELNGVHWRAIAGDEKASAARTIRKSLTIPTHLSELWHEKTPGW